MFKNPFTRGTQTRVQPFAAQGVSGDARILRAGGASPQARTAVAVNSSDPAVQRVIVKAMTHSDPSVFADSVPLEVLDDPVDANAAAEHERMAPVLEQGATPVTPAAVTLLTDITKLPVGQYMPLSTIAFSSQHESFALMQTGRGVITLLGTPEGLSSHTYYEIRKRIRNTNNTLGQTITATGEVIRSLHMRNQAKRELGEATAVEDQASQLIQAAYDAGTSDIHIETREMVYARVYFRIHGKRIEQPNLSFDTASGIANVLYTVQADSSSKSTNWSSDSIRNGAIEREMADGKAVQLRFHSAPIHPAGNFHIVIRILRMDSEAAQPIETIGYTAEMCEALEEMIVGSQGLVVLVGPTNSGKSTSLQSLIKRMYERRGDTTKVISVEDPVEYTIANACQMGVSTGRKDQQDSNGSVFNNYLAATLRADPDVLMVGEIRTGETAGMVKDMVLAGRKILTTLHAYEAMAVFPRLRELGVPESVLYMDGFLSGVIYQRLVPVLCKHCSLSLAEAQAQGLIHESLHKRVLMVANLEEHDVRVANPHGCDHCKSTGIIGRTVCAEVLVPDRMMLHHIRKGNPVAIRNHWERHAAHAIEDLGVTALAHAIYKMRKGMLDPRDVESQIGRLRIERLIDDADAY